MNTEAANGFESDREGRSRNPRQRADHFHGIDMEEYRQRMRALTADRDLRIRFRNVTRMPDEDVGAELQELGLNLTGSHRARAERLYRA